MTRRSRRWWWAALALLATLALVLVLVRQGIDETAARSRSDAAAGRARSPAVSRARIDVPSSPEELPRLAVSGTVVDDGDRPVAGAEVNLIGLEGRVTTDEHGAFAFEGLPPGPYRLEARTAAAYGGPVFARVDSPRDEPIVIRVRAGLVLEVRVIRASTTGSPQARIADAEVAVLSGSPIARGGLETSATVIGRTNVDGVATFPAVPGEDTLVVVRSAGFVASSRVVSAREVTGTKHVVVVSLRPGGMVKGRVVDDEGHPMPGATVVPTRLPDLAWTREMSALLGSGAVTTGDDGTFELGLEDGPWHLRATADGYGPAISDSIGVAVGKPVTGVTLVLTAGIHVLGKVVTDAGAPAAGAWVTVSPQFDQGVLQRIQADGRGEFDLGGLAPSHIRISGSTSIGTSAAQRLDLTGGKDVTGIVLTIDQTASITGRVLDARGVPVAGAVVTALPVAATSTGTVMLALPPPAPIVETTDAAGRFELVGLRRTFTAGELPAYIRERIGSLDSAYQIRAYVPSPVLGTRVPTTVVVARIAQTGVELRTPTPAVVTGRVRFRDRARIDEVAAAWNNDAAVHFRDGSFRLDVYAPGAGTVNLRARGGSRRIPVETRPGETIDVGEVELQR